MSAAVALVLALPVLLFAASLTRDAWAAVGFWVSVTLVACVAGLLAGVALGQEPSDVDTLTRCVMGEGSSNGRDHAAQLHVHAKRARWSGRTLVEQATEFANGCDAARVERDRVKYPEAWAAAQKRVQAFLAGELPDPCKGQADNWGGTAKGTERDQQRIAACLAAGTCAVVDCGDTLNTFLRGVR